MKIDPRHLEIIAAIVDCGGLTEAAELLNKSQPSLSRTLADLELRIGAPLFLPGRRPLQPTELGRALAQSGRMVLQAGQAGSAVIEKFRAGHQGLVRVGGTPIFMDGVVSEMIADFQANSPDVRVDQIYGYRDALVLGLRNQSLDLGILPIAPEDVPTDLVFDPILPSQNVIACREGHPLTRRGIVHLEEIVKYPWVTPPVESPLYHDLKRALQRIGAEGVRVSSTGGSLAAALNILAASDALTILPFSVVFSLRKRRALTALPINITAATERRLGILVSRETLVDPTNQRFRRFIEARFKVMGQQMTRRGQETIWRG